MENYLIMKNIFSYLNYEDLIQCQSVSKDFRYYADSILNNNEIMIKLKEETVDYKELNEEFVERNINYVNMNKVSSSIKLSENFIEKYKDKLDWIRISAFQNLSMDFIRKHKYLVDWNCISTYQNLSIEFIKEHKDLVNWRLLIKYDKIPTNQFYSIMYQYREEINRSIELYDLQQIMEIMEPSELFNLL